MKRSELVFSEVSRLYASAPTSMGKWMWHNHTQWVADKAKALAVKYGADVEQVYCAALIHDLGDSKYERDDALFETWSWVTGKAILKNTGFRKKERDEILEAVRTHSCHPGYLPATQEGRVLATADALWHLQTNFFPVICYMNRPDDTHTYAAWQEWFSVKIKRDFGTKIFFAEERAEAKDDYEALLRVFGKESLDAAID